MILDTVNKSLRFVLGEAKTTTNCDVVSVYADTTNSEFLPTSVNLVTNGTTAVTCVAAPGTGVQRQVNEIRLFNNDSVTHAVTLQYDNNGTIAVIDLASLAPGASFLYTPESSSSSSSGGGGGQWNAGTVDFLSSNLTIRSGASLDLANSISISGTATAAAGAISGLIQAGTVTSSGALIGATETISGVGKVGTLTVGLSTPFTSFSTHFSVTSSTLDVTGFGTGSVTSVVSGAGLHAGTITATGTLLADWNGGTVSAISNNLTIASGTLDLANSVSITGTVTAAAVSISGLVAAGTVTSSGSVSAASGTIVGLLQAGTITSVGAVIGASGSISGTDTVGTLVVGASSPFSVFGTGLSISSGTLSATGTGGTVTSVVSGAGLHAGTITSAGTLLADWNAGTVTTIGDALLLSAGTLSGDIAATPTLFSATGSVVVPAGLKHVDAELWGGGGGSGATTGTIVACGSTGGGGGYARGYFSVTPGATLTVTVGAGGAGGLAIGTAPADGGDTIFQGLTAFGGDAGVNADAFGNGTPGGAGGAVTGAGAYVSYNGQNGLTNWPMGTAFATAGGGGSWSFPPVLPYGTDSVGINAAYPGCAGGAANSDAGANYAGGNGMDGQVIVRFVP